MTVRKTRRTRSISVDGQRTTRRAKPYRRDLRRSRLSRVARVSLLALAFGSFASSSYGWNGVPPDAALTPSLVGGNAGGSIRLVLKAPFTASEPTEIPWHAAVHLPLGTTLNFARLPKKALCNKDALLGSSDPQKACPKSSRAGPVGSAQLEEIAGGQPTFVTTPVYPFVVASQGGTAGIALDIEPPAPLIHQIVLVENFKDAGPPGAQFLTVSSLYGISALSVTLGGNAKIGGRNTPLVVMPKSCPKGGFRWRVDLSATIAPERTTPATSPCSGKS